MKTREWLGVAAVLGAGALLASAPSMQAQATASGAAATDTVTLTLERALDIAAQNNPAYRKASNNLDLNPVEMRSTWFDEILPNASVRLFDTQYTGNLTHRATDNFGNPIANPKSDWVYFSATQQQLSLNWVIRGQSLFQSYRRQKLANQSRTVAADQAQMAMELWVRRTYNDAMKQRDLLAAEEDLVAARRLDKDAADRLFSLALKTRVDVLNADLNIQKQVLQVQQQRAVYEKALLSLRTRLGDDALGPIRLADEAVQVFDPGRLDAEALVRRAQAVNPTLRQAQVGVDQQREAVSEANTLWWPTLQLGWNVGRTAQTQEAKALFDVSYNEPMDSRFWATLSFPMFNDFFQNRAQQARASVALQNQRADARQARLDLEQQVRGALLELENQYQILQTNQQAAQIAQEALRLAREEYRIGTRTFTELRAAINDEADSRRQVIQARYGFADALLTLEEAVGATVSPPATGGGS